jgi:hypothetical protein
MAGRMRESARAGRLLLTIEATLLIAVSLGAPLVELLPRIPVFAARLCAAASATCQAPRNR